MKLYDELILMVDDDPVCQQILRINVEALDYRFLALSEGSGFLEVVKEKQPSLILIDVHLPDCSGFDLCTALKVDPDTDRIPVLFLTIASDPESIDEAFQRGAIDYITKPFRPAEIASRIQAQVRLNQANRRLEKELAIKRKLFSLISHDLRSPFSSMVGVLQLLLTEYDSMADVDRREFMQALLDNSSQQLQLLDNLTYWSRGQSNRIVVRPAPESLRALVEASVDHLSVLVEAKKIVVNNLVPPQQMVVVDPELIQVVIRNILHNAIKYSHTGAQVIIRLDDGQVQAGEGRIALLIEDTGTGFIVPQRAFSDMEFNSATGTGGEKGAGIGLVIARGLMESQGGFLELISTGRNGTTIGLYLPIGFTSGV